MQVAMYLISCHAAELAKVTYNRNTAMNYILNAIFAFSRVPDAERLFYDMSLIRFRKYQFRAISLRLFFFFLRLWSPFVLIPFTSSPLSGCSLHVWSFPYILWLLVPCCHGVLIFPLLSTTYATPVAALTLRDV
jgi:hypothetical protein